MSKALFLTCESQTEFFVDDQLFMNAMEKLGWQCTLHPWNGPALRWSDFDVAILRTTWDYYKNPSRFLEVLGDIEQSDCRLWNPLSVVRWNSDKSYLRDLVTWGLKIAPTIWSKALAFNGEQSPFEIFDCEEIIVKPTVSVGAFDTLLLTKEQWNPEQLKETYKDRDILVQKCLSAVRELGEYSLVFFAEEFSHAILKTPKAGDFRVQSFYGGKERAVEVPAEAIRQGQLALQAVSEAPLYARVDMVLQDGQWLLMELELIEPQLFLPMIDFEKVCAETIVPFLNRY
ncbi:MAG: hypothetical protein P1V97_20005 [Planctomycetota bacterium]|nr:hypothetical protein [Planctomycetota bacterium]